MTELIKDRYVVAYLIAYSGGILLAIKQGIQVGDLLATALMIGIGFTALAFFVTPKAVPLFNDVPTFKGEAYWLISLVCFTAFFISSFHRWPGLDDLVLSDNSRLAEISTGLLKLIFMVGPTWLVYKLAFGFRWQNWGLGMGWRSYSTRTSWSAILIFAVVLSLFQYFLGSGAQPLREGLYSVGQVVPGIILNFLWVILTVGIVEEFFFRVFLQSRLTMILRSEMGGIVVSAVLFGLVHAPGIYLRGGGILANLGTEPGWMMSVVYSFLVLSVAGFFLSVIWLRTKNFWLIVAIHAMVDLLPGLSEFIEVWGL